MAGRLRAAVPVAHHLSELRVRLIIVAVVLFVGSGLGYAFRELLIKVLKQPLGEKLYYTSPSGSFEFVVQLSLLVGFVFALPVLIYQLIRFIEPAFPKALTHKRTTFVVIASWLLAVGGVAFGFMVSLPSTLEFFTHVGTDQLQSIITADQYFSFVCSYLAIFAAVFQLPLILLVINFFTPLGPGSLRKARKFVIVGGFGLAVITPGAQDPITQTVMAIPVILLYEASGIMLWFVNRGRRRDEGARRITAPTPARAAKSSPGRAAVTANISSRDATVAYAQVPVRPPRQSVRPLDLRVISGSMTASERQSVRPAHAAIDKAQVRVERPAAALEASARIGTSLARMRTVDLRLENGRAYGLSPVIDLRHLSS